MAMDNNPNIILRLVAYGHRAQQVWADSHNEPFYLAPLSQATNGGLQEVVVSPNNRSRGVTPSSDDPDLEEVSEPALEITFSQKPKNPELGYLLGSDRGLCDIFLGSTDDYISRQMFTISFNQHNEVIMKSSSRNTTVVTYGRQTGERQTGERKIFTWIFPPGLETISVKAARRITFSVEVPTHETDNAAYEANCRNFMMPAVSASQTMNQLNFSSRPDTKLASVAATDHATTEPAFYLRTEKIGDGGFGVVYKARSMPDGGTVAVKEFKSKKAWTLEADVLRKLLKTPHDNIVKFIDCELGDKPYLVMGLALGGNLDEQNRLMPFSIWEVGLILRQMLDALVYLHLDFKMIHRDIKPTNILCDSRSHFRLADFGLAKEGDIFKTRKGTRPYMAPEVFANEPYTAAVDLWALGLVIAQYLSPDGGPPGYQGSNKGPGWCAAVVAHFKKYEEYSQATGSDDSMRGPLNHLVGQHMLRMKPEDRQPALGCLEQGTYLWRFLSQESNDGSKTPTRENPTGSFPNKPRVHNADGPPNGSWCTEENVSSEDDESETERADVGGRSLKTDDRSTLKKKHPIKGVKGKGKEGGSSGPQHFIHSPSAGSSGNVPRASTTAASSGHPGRNPPQHNAATNAANNAHGQTPDPALMNQVRDRYGAKLMAWMKSEDSLP